MKKNHNWELLNFQVPKILQVEHFKYDMPFSNMLFSKQGWFTAHNPTFIFKTLVLIQRLKKNWFQMGVRGPKFSADEGQLINTEQRREIQKLPFYNCHNNTGFKQETSMNTKTAG